MYAVAEIIKCIFSKSNVEMIDYDTYVKMKYHSIDLLLAPFLSSLIMPDELRAEWKKRIINQIALNLQREHMQKQLPITVPYVILKGTSASQYYPHPQYRTMGDIDIITKREDFNQAYHELVNNGFTICKELEREVGFIKNGIVIELHRYFASLNDPKKAKYMDDLIIENITPYHVLPDDINGLVLLEHINQHLEKGLGLRQIIDWMMFVDKCLPDEKWPAFEKYAKAIGLDNLAVVTTRMCEIYLGLPQRAWCSGADEELCEQLMDYIMACGNFGIIRAQNISTGENVFYLGKTPKSFLGLLQERGLANWEAARKRKYLRPFAWLYQLNRYAFRGIGREGGFSKAREEYKAAHKRVDMFRKLGVRQSADGLAVYKNGKYVKRKHS